MSILTQNFSPKNCTSDGNYTLSATISGGNQVLPQPPTLGSGPIGGGYQTLLIFNSGTVPVFLSWGMSSQASVVTTAGFAIAPSAVYVIDMGNPCTNLGFITGSSTATVYVSLGAGG